MSNSGKIQDASTAAISAIEKALDVTAPEAEGEQGSAAQVSGSRLDAPVGLTPALPPANDDRRSVGELRQALNIPANHSIMALTIASIILWAVCWTFYVYFNKGEIVEIGGSLLAPKPILALGALVGPIAFLFITGLMARRAHEMRLIANSMTEVAIRLIEPETIATEQVVTLSQAIRREAASMGEGIERALIRAGELELIVRNEVTNLERTYSENERRIRLLIDELTREREAIIVHADNARTALYGARDSLSQELASGSAYISETVEAAGDRVTSLLGSKSEEIRAALEQASDSFEASLSTHSAAVVGVLSETEENVVARMNESSDVLRQRLAQGLLDVTQRLNESGDAINADFYTRGETILERFEALGSGLTASLGAQGDQLVSRLAETGDVIHETMTTHGGALDRSLSQTTESFV